MDEKIYLGNGRYLNLKEIAVALKEEFPKGFKATHGMKFLISKYFLIPRQSWKAPLFREGKIFKKLYEKGFLSREPFFEIMGSNGIKKVRYYYLVQLNT